MSPSTNRAGRRLRVAIVYPFFAHYRAALLRELREHGRHEYLFVAAKRDPAGSIPVMQFDDDAGFLHAPCKELGAGLLWQRNLIALALRRDVDCIVYLGNAAFPATWISALLSRVTGKRVLFWTHGWLAREGGLKGRVRNLFYKRAHGLLLYGQHGRRIGLDLGFEPARLHVIYNSLDVEQQLRLRREIPEHGARELRAQMFSSPDTPVVLAVGRLTQGKRFDLLIHAVALLHRAGHAVNLLIVGAGPAESELKELARREGIGHKFVGACYEEAALARMFASANVTVSPGNVGLTCMHSLAYGVPVITHDDPADQGPEWEAITPRVTGTFFRKGSVTDLAAAILQYTRHAHVDAQTREQCLHVVMDRYHPAVQRELIEAAIEATPGNARAGVSLNQGSSGSGSSAVFRKA